MPASRAEACHNRTFTSTPPAFAEAASLVGMTPPAAKVNPPREQLEGQRRDQRAAGEGEQRFCAFRFKTSAVCSPQTTHRGSAVARDVVHGVLLDQALQVIGVYGLVLDQLGGELVQQLTITNQYVLGGVVGLIDDPADLLVYLEGDLIRVVRLVVEVAAHENLPLLVA